MKRLSGFMASVALVASASAVPAFAADSQMAAASKLSLMGAEGAMSKCVKRDGFDGKWRLDQATGGWARCGGKTGLWIGLGVLAVGGGIAAAVAGGGSKSP